MANDVYLCNLGIRVRGLRKEFSKFRGEGVLAVDQVSFSAYHGEITTLLGHNGAGKTTTMSGNPKI